MQLIYFNKEKHLDKFFLLVNHNSDRKEYYFNAILFSVILK